MTFFYWLTCGSHLDKHKLSAEEEEANKLDEMVTDMCNWTLCRIVFTTGTLVGALGMIMYYVYDFPHLQTVFSALWLVIALFAMFYNWNYAVRKALADSQAKIFEDYKVLKAGMGDLKENNAIYDAQNKSLKESVDKLAEQEKKLSRASEMLSGEIVDLKVIAEKQRDMLRKSFEIIQERQKMTLSQIAIQEGCLEGELEWQRGECVARVRCYFQDAGAKVMTRFICYACSFACLVFSFCARLF
jgi:hypothetical protein